MCYLGRVGLLQLLLVELDLGLVLATEVVQRIGKLALELPLAPVVNLHQARLVTAFGLAELLQGAAGEQGIPGLARRHNRPPNGDPFSPPPAPACSPHDPAAPAPLFPDVGRKGCRNWADCLPQGSVASSSLLAHGDGFSIVQVQMISLLVIITEILA